MTVLSRQSIIKYMQRSKDPIEIYTTSKSGKKCNVPLKCINSNSVNLSIGSTVEEMDHLILMDKLSKVKDIFYLDQNDYLSSLGIHPIEDRKQIEQSIRTLDLYNLGEYHLEKEPVGEAGKMSSWRVMSKDEKYTFRTRITKERDDDKKASGIIIHPEMYDFNERFSRIYSKCHDVLKLNEEILHCSILALSKLKNGKIPKKYLNEMERLVEKNRGMKSLLELTTETSPSTSFTVCYTQEYLHMPLDLTGKLDTKSRLARIGVSVHPSSGKVDAGFNNQLALEIKNIGYVPVILNVGDPVAEVQFEKLDRPTNLGYEKRKDALYKKREKF